jgi:hypothetical protein
MSASNLNSTLLTYNYIAAIPHAGVEVKGVVLVFFFSYQLNICKYQVIKFLQLLFKNYIDKVIWRFKASKTQSSYSRG